MSREFTIAYSIVLLVVASPVALAALCVLAQPRSLLYFEQISLLRWPFSFLRFARDYRRTSDPWLATRCGASHKLFGLGSNYAFDWYFTGESTHPAGSLDGVCSFLRGCEYVGDEEQFDCWDLWQHPLDFEQRMRGDCEDHALWAWRRLCESGIDAEFFVGRRAKSDARHAARHAWVVLHEADGDKLLESVSKSKDKILRPVADVRDDYTPYFSVDREFCQWMYGGYLTRFSKPQGHAPNQIEMRNT